MIVNPAIPRTGGVPHPFTLNDLRVQNTVAEPPSSASARAYSSLALAVVLAAGAFVWLDPLHLFTPTEAPPAPAFASSAEPARRIERQEIVAPLTPVPATKSVEAPPAPVAATKSVEAPPAPVVRAPPVPAPVVRPRVASIKPESRGNPMDKPDTTVRRVGLEEMPAPPALLTKPEEKTDAPIVPKFAEETKSAPKSAATNDQTPVTD